MVRLDSIELTNFRGIEHGQVNGLADVNLIVGRNNSGKTTVAEAIMRVAAALSPGQDVIGRDMIPFWAVVRREANPYVAELIHRSDAARVVALTLNFETDNERRVAAQFRVSMNGSHGLTASAEVEKKTSQGTVFDFLRRVTAFLPSDGTNRSIEEHLWGGLLNTRLDKQLVRQLSEIYDLEIEQITVPPDGRMKLLMADHAVSLDVQGDGARAAMRCLIMLSALKDTLLIIEEPENHQNPTALRRFAKAVCGLAAVQRVQLFIPTHSLECVRAFLEGAASPEQVAVFHFELEEGRFSAKRLGVDAAETLIDSGVDPRSLSEYL